MVYARRFFAFHKSDVPTHFAAGLGEADLQNVKITTCEEIAYKFRDTQMCSMSDDRMAEWSKAFDSSSNHESGAGSNPAPVTCKDLAGYENIAQCLQVRMSAFLNSQGT